MKLRKRAQRNPQKERKGSKIVGRLKSSSRNRRHGLKEFYGKKAEKRENRRKGWNEQRNCTKKGGDKITPPLRDSTEYDRPRKKLMLPFRLNIRKRGRKRVNVWDLGINDYFADTKKKGKTKRLPMTLHAEFGNTKAQLSRADRSKEKEKKGPVKESSL